MSQGESGVTQWTSQQFIAASQRDKQPFACRNVVSFVSLIFMSLEGEKKLEYQERTNAERKRKHKLST